MPLTPNHHSPVSRQRGMSLVEMMIGIVLGLFIVSSASVVMTNQLTGNRQLMLESQIQQELRTAADLVARDIRRSGYWTNASTAVLQPSAMSSTNPYRIMDTDRSHSVVSFSYSTDAQNSRSENDQLDNDERTGFKLQDDTLKIALGNGNWQPVTDPNLVKITTFDLVLSTAVIDLSAYCSNPCPTGSSCNPTQTVRSITITLKGTAAHDPLVNRTLRSTVRLRNDLLAGACAA